VTAIENYLAELDELLVDVDSATRDGLVGGIREELVGLTDAEAQARLRALGDPAYVAAGVLAEIPAPAARERTRDATWYSVLTVVLLTIGGVVVPVLGWIVGLIMLWAARGWTLVHKAIGTLLALAGPGGLLLLLFPVGATITYPEPNPNPLLPPTIPWWTIALVLAVVWLVGWVWLLVVANRSRR
jgi:hypothetical protein